jgi:hypothetical protein
MRSFFQGLHRSFPVQLLLLHLRSHFLLLLVWLLVVLMMSGILGPRLGIQYLFLDPEYLDMIGFWPFLIIGLAFGFFTMSWNLSTYLLIGGYFNFLASLSRPFFKYSINNALLPLGVFLAYCVWIVRFLRPGGNTADDWVMASESLSGLILGLVISLFGYAIYFNLTNRDISYYLPKFREPPPNMGPSRTVKQQASGYRPYRTRALASTLISLYDNPYRVTTYLNEQLKTRLVRSVAHYDSAVLQGIFRQNHVNAILLQFISIFSLAMLGFLIDEPLFQIPAVASFLILLSLLVAIIGAISYWFSEWSFPLLLLLLAGFNWLTTTPFFPTGNQAYGLDYGSRSVYDTDKLAEDYHNGVVAEDLAATIAILDNWKARQPQEKPPFFVVCASGGGLTAGLWAMHVAQTLDKLSGERLLPATALMTGASGGLFGLAYLREAYRRDTAFHQHDAYRLDRISRDLLNSVAFSIVSNDLFLPFTTVEISGRTYRRDRAYNFEQELNRNTDGWLDKPLSAYREPEQRADIPLLFLTPSIVEDGSRLVISPQGVSYMAATPAALRGDLDLRPDMVDFRRLLAGQSPDSLRFTTALRMNATYPYVLPLVNLPTRPVVRAMDAGYRDNYGIASATRFLSVFRDWIRENTSGVHLVQISAFREKPTVEATDERTGVIENFFGPVGVAGNILGVQILDQEVLLGQLSDLLGPDFFHLHRFNYQSPANDPLQASVSLHLTEQERRQVLLRLDDAEMMEQLMEVVDVLRE